MIRTKFAKMVRKCEYTDVYRGDMSLPWRWLKIRPWLKGSSSNDGGIRSQDLKWKLINEEVNPADV